jgi:hypothetical protein
MFGRGFPFREPAGAIFRTAGGGNPSRLGLTTSGRKSSLGWLAKWGRDAADDARCKSIERRSRGAAELGCSR